MKKLSLIMAVLMAIGLFAGCAQQENAEQLPGDEEAPAKEYQYITADEVKTMIENGDEKVIVDIQPEEYYAQGHLPTAISTYAYPADTDELKAKLDAIAEGATKVEASETNGNIKINGTETTVYTEPSDVVHGAVATDGEVTEMLNEVFTTTGV